MSVVGSLDAIAVKVGNITGIKRAYSVGVAPEVRPIPRTIDDVPVATIYTGSGDMASGNAETVVMTTTVDIWAGADDGATLAGFIDLARPVFRADMNLGGECTRCLMAGWSEPETAEVNGRQYLVLPIQLEILITRFASDATA